MTLIIMYRINREDICKSTYTSTGLPFPRRVTRWSFTVSPRVKGISKLFLKFIRSKILQTPVLSRFPFLCRKEWRRSIKKKFFWHPNTFSINPTFGFGVWTIRLLKTIYNSYLIDVYNTLLWRQGTLISKRYKWEDKRQREKSLHIKSQMDCTGTSSGFFYFNNIKFIRGGISWKGSCREGLRTIGRPSDFLNLCILFCELKGRVPLWMYYLLDKLVRLTSR